MPCLDVPLGEPFGPDERPFVTRELAQVCGGVDEIGPRYHERQSLADERHFAAPVLVVPQLPDALPVRPVAVEVQVLPGDDMSVPDGLDESPGGFGIDLPH